MAIEVTPILKYKKCSDLVLSGESENQSPLAWFLQNPPSKKCGADLENLPQTILPPSRAGIINMEVEYAITPAYWPLHILKVDYTYPLHLDW